MKKYIPTVLVVLGFSSCKITRSLDESQGPQSNLASVGLKFDADKFPFKKTVEVEKKRAFAAGAVLKLNLKNAEKSAANCKPQDIKDKIGEFSLKNTNFEIQGLKLSDQCEFIFDLQLVSKDLKIVYFKQNGGPSSQKIDAKLDDKKNKVATVKLTLCVDSDPESLFDPSVKCVDSKTGSEEVDAIIDVTVKKNDATSPSNPSPKAAEVSKAVDETLALISKSENSTGLKEVFESDLKALTDKSSATVTKAIQSLEGNLSNGMVTTEISDKIKTAIKNARMYLDANE